MVKVLFVAIVFLVKAIKSAAKIVLFLPKMAFRKIFASIIHNQTRKFLFPCIKCLFLPFHSHGKP